MYPTLEEVVGQAIIDRDFCAGLLNGRRARLLSQYNLTPEEMQVAMAIRADTLQSFAGQLYEWIESQKPRQRRLRLA